MKKEQLQATSKRAKEQINDIINDLRTVECRFNDTLTDKDGIDVSDNYNSISKAIDSLQEAFKYLQVWQE